MKGIEKQLGTSCSWKLRIRALGTGVLFFSFSFSLTFLLLHSKPSQPDEICKYMNLRFNIFQSRKQLIAFSILSLKNTKKKILEMDYNLPGLGQMSSTRLCACGFSCSYQVIKVIYNPQAWLILYYLRLLDTYLHHKVSTTSFIKGEKSLPVS